MAGKVYIMRGLPGSGKTTWVKRHSELFRPNEFVVCSADDYHVDPDGIYRFKPDRVGWAHNKCLMKFISNLWTQFPHVYVDNTNTSVWELAPYYRLGEAFGYDVVIVTVLATPEACAARGTHGVPVETIARMQANLDKSEEMMPRWWQRLDVQSL